MPVPTPRRTVWSYLGRVPYEDGAALQEGARGALRRGAGPERLLLLEHPHVYTLGRNAAAADVLAEGAWLRVRGIEVAETNRGGQVTYHGPGQLVGYPILDLNPDRRDIRRYVRDLVEVLVRTLADYGVAARAGEDRATIGVWTDAGKIASVGVHLSRWITSHGFALNVATDLRHFDLIVPCGITDKGVTSLERLVGRPVPMAEVESAVTQAFASVFDATP